MAILFSARTDVGRVREQNEDNFLVDRKLQLYIVCDGMGGHLGGEVASATAVNIVRETMLQHQQILHAYGRHDGTAGVEDVHALLIEAVQEASFRIHERGLMNAEQRGMGTTLSLLLVLGDRGFIAHVGDSRVYRWRHGIVSQLTEDHSLRNAMKQSGASFEGVDIGGRLKNAVTRAVGAQESVEVDTIEVPLLAGDRFLLCSDGLHGYFDEAELAELLDGDIALVPERLIHEANTRGGEDNITAVIIELPGSGELASSAEAPSADEALAASALAAGLDGREVIALRRRLGEVHCGVGQDVIKQGAPGDAMLIVLEGELAVVGDGMRVVRAHAGDLLGAVMLLTGQQHPATIKVIGDSPARLLRLSREGLARLATDDPALLARITLNLARQLAGGIVDASMATGDSLWLYGAPSAPITRPREGRPRVATITMDLDPSEIIEADRAEEAAPGAEPPPPPEPPGPARGRTAGDLAVTDAEPPRAAPGQHTPAPPPAPAVPLAADENPGGEEQADALDSSIAI